MQDHERQLDSILEKIAQEIAITPAMIDKAIQSYEAVGKWIGDGVPYDVQVSPQGSMNLGTTIKPITDKDDYDIDLVCMLKKGQDLSPREIKNIVGNRLKENEIYRKKIAEEGEGKRCWKMQYDAFHMDILPCAPAYDLYKEPDFTDIRLTHKNERQQYENRYSNPYGYRIWFENRMKENLEANLREFAIRNQVDIKEVPTYRVPTSLRMAIQLLKRHRDMMFQNDVDNKPISIIITTLAAEAYNGESSVYETLCQCLNHMSSFIKKVDGIDWIPNPVMKQENFADKWQIHPERKKAFYEWLRKAQNDLITAPLSTLGLENIKSLYADCLGEAPVNRAFKSIGIDQRMNRDNNHLYMDGLQRGLTNELRPNSIPVKKHTFYGKE